MKLNFKYILFSLFAGLVCQESDSTMSMSGGFGSITLDGDIYNQISFSPEIPVGKLTIGFDFYLNIDSQGNPGNPDFYHPRLMHKPVYISHA